jgi:four helix bundle protein
LSSQTRRAAYSAAANIAEGSAKRGTAEFCRYLNISLGSLSELAYAMMLIKDLQLLGNADWQRIEKLRSEASKSTWGLYRSIQQKKKAPWIIRPPVRLTI